MTMIKFTNTSNKIEEKFPNANDAYDYFSEAMAVGSLSFYPSFLSSFFFYILLLFFSFFLPSLTHSTLEARIATEADQIAEAQKVIICVYLRV